MKLSVKRKNNGQTGSIELDNKQLAKFCLKLCGGGWSEIQTTNALIMQRDLLNGKEVETENNFWSLVI